MNRQISFFKTVWNKLSVQNKTKHRRDLMKIACERIPHCLILLSIMTRRTVKEKHHVINVSK